MRDQSSQFVPNSGLHVAGENKIRFQTIIFEGVNFIVNIETCERKIVEAQFEKWEG